MSSLRSPAGLTALVLAFLAGIGVGAAVAVLVVDGGDGAGVTRLERFCELGRRLEALQAVFGFQEEQVAAAPVDEVVANLEDQHELQGEILEVAPAEIRQSVGVVVERDGELLPKLIAELREAGTVRAFLDRVRAAGFSTDAIGRYLGATEEETAAYARAVRQNRRYFEAVCDSSTPGAGAPAASLRSPSSEPGPSARL